MARSLSERALRALDTAGIPRAVEAKGPETVAEYRTGRTLYSIALSLVELNRNLRALVRSDNVELLAEMLDRPLRDDEHEDDPR